EDHWHRKLRRQSRRFFLRFGHPYVAIFLSHHAQHCRKRRPVTLRLLQGHANRLDAIEIGPPAKVFVSLAPVRQIRQFGGREREFLGQRDRLRSDLVTDLSERGFDRHARFDANQEQVKGVGENPFDRQLAAFDLVLKQQERQLHADVGGKNADAELDRRRLIELENHKQVDQRKQETCD